MAGLQRSVTSFRRQGSSGLVWDDKSITADQKDMSGDTSLNPNEDTQKLEDRELRPPQSVDSNGMANLSRSKESHPRQHRTAKVNSPLPYTDPPSPKVGSCGLLCSMFSKPADPKSKSKSRRRS